MPAQEENFDSRRPSIADMKALQAFLHKQEYHLVFFDEGGFVMAHTDEERAAIDLNTCALHVHLMTLDAPPVREKGYYMYLPATWKYAKLPRHECELVIHRHQEG